MLEIQHGDTVTWEWELDLPGSGLTVNVFQTPSMSSSVRLEGGFASDSSTAGSFSVTFTQTGTYYYASELSQQLIVRGVVNVTSPASQRAGIEVSVGGIVADFVPLASSGDGDSDSSPLTPDSDDDMRRRRQTNECIEEPDANEGDEGGISLVYSICSTPLVTSVAPLQGTIFSNFTLMGSLLASSVGEDTIVTFGGHNCNVIFSSDTELVCQMNPSSMPPSFTSLPLSVTVPGLGIANIDNVDQTTIELQPIITDLSPSQGSVEGETDFFIFGYGFPDEEISVNDFEIDFWNYSLIVCVTPANSEEVVELSASLRNDMATVFVCGIEGGCSFNYTLAYTPVVSEVSPMTLIGPNPTTLNISGQLFSDSLEGNQVLVGNSPCWVTYASTSFLQCSLDALPADNYPISVLVCPPSPTEGAFCPGLTQVSVGSLSSPAVVASVSPLQGSIAGGTQLTISGYGFSSDSSQVSVSIGGSECTVSLASYSYIQCTTTASAPGTYDIEITSHGVDFPGLNYTYSAEETPSVISISPTNGQEGTVMTIYGTNLEGSDSSTYVAIGGVECLVDAQASNSTAIVCEVGINFAGEHSIDVDVSGLGRALSDVSFNYNLELTSFSPMSGSFAGMSALVIEGKGFNPTDMSISVCGQLCPLSTTPGSLSQVECILPSMVPSETDVACSVVVESVGMAVYFNSNFTYSPDLTPVVFSISRTRGGTQGGSQIYIYGDGFGSDVNVSIAGIPCEVLVSNSTHILCETGASGRTIRAPVMVYVEGMGFARSENVEFWYVDLWSSRFTWGGEDPPREGDFVVIPRGQTLVLDTVTPVLAYLLVQGGELIFDDEAVDGQVELHTRGMLITSGGKLEVGTEDKPFLAKTQIVLYGDALSTEIPVYGAKTLALRQGSLDIHGKPLNVTWTRLAQSASAGDTMIYLQEAVDWDVGGKIVLASTSFSQRENEELTITGIDGEGKRLSVSPALRYDHISVMQTFEGRMIDTSAEVGYLTRNVVVRGNTNEEWVSEASACPEEFRPGQFQIQTCFLGRFGNETLSDQFGSQIMIHASAQNQGDVVGRFSYIEVTHAGQAFRLGRYPIHFHLNGNVSGSYVRGCSIHHTFNRAVTVHAVDYLLVEKNVAYNILGHAYFLEDGIEENNIIQDNLGVFVRASSSLLNVDITPATFWVVNPNNVVRRNAAAGGTHFGFWYRLPQNPTGPSFTSSVCPRHIPLGEFTDNSAHSFGWYGLWVFPTYSPREGGSCSSSASHVPAVFTNFLAWRNDRGVEFGDAGVSSGALQLHNSTMLDNELAGVEVTAFEAEWGEPLIQNVVIVAHSEITASDSSVCTEAGIITPQTPYLSVQSVTFINFDREGCTAVAACSHCRNLQGGFETRYADIKFVNSPRLAFWKWKHEHVHRDMDGTLTETGTPSLIIPSVDILPPSCMSHASSSYGIPGSICPGSLEMTRFALNDAAPSSIRTQLLNITNAYGTERIEYEDKRLILPDGHMAILPVNESYRLQWETGPIFTNTSYRLLVTGLATNNYILVEQPYPEELDFISVAGRIVMMNESVFEDLSQVSTGDWYSDENYTINYIVKGTESETVDLRFLTYVCFFEDCIPPPPPTLPPPIPPGRPEITQSWSNASIWPNDTLPRAGDNVYINCSWYVLLDVPIPRLGVLTICGALEILDSMDHVIEADIILITGGRLVAGYPDTPFTSELTFLLHGNRSSPEVQFEIGPILGAKALGVFGELIFTGTPKSPIWTNLAATVEAGGMEISLSNSVNWEEGDRIVITSTSFEGKQSETATINSVSNSNTLILRDPLQYRHVYETQTIGSQSYTIAAEVGLLSRNIAIGNGGEDTADRETFGCRVLVGNIVEDGQVHVGSIQMDGVELKGCGQLGYTDTFDPRFALAVLNANGRDSYVRRSSIYDGYNTGVGAFGSSGIEISDNVIHNTVGSAIQATGSDLVITGNLASLSNYLPTYRESPTAQPENPDWTANYELASTFNLTLRGNVAGGGGKVGFHVNGDSCDSTGNALQVSGNTAHSTLHGYHLGYEDGHPSGCTHIAEFTAHSCYHYAIFSYNSAEVKVSSCTLVNNYAGIYVSVIGPPSLSHMLGDKEVVIEDTLIVSASPGLDCDADSIVPEIALHPQSFHGINSPTEAHVGIIIPTFVSGPGHRTLSGWLSISSYPAINGMSTIRDVTFANFGQRCPGKRDVLLITHERSEDCNHPAHLERITLSGNAMESVKYYNHDPILGSINPSDCVDMDCDGLKHVLVKDVDGTFLGDGMAVTRTFVSMAEIGWGDNGSRGIGNFRIPRAMLTTENGGMADADALFPGKGIVRGTESFGESQCSWMAEWNSYLCEGVNHLMLVIESLDDDTEVGRVICHTPVT